MTRVFLSYTRRERELAERVGGALDRAGLGAADRWEVATAGEWATGTERSFRANDVVVVVLPSGVASWSDSEAEFVLARELDRRGVELIPVAGAAARPSGTMRDRAYVDLTGDFDAGVRTLLAQIRTVSRIDYSAMTPDAFGALVADLLAALGFRLDTDFDAGSDSGAELRATFRGTDPFGRPETEVWLVDTKLYSHERVSVEAIRRLAGALSNATASTRGLLVTNTQLTSVAEDYVAEVTREVRLRVLDGVALRRLLREFPAVAARHFAGGDEVRLRC